MNTDKNTDTTGPNGIVRGFIVHMGKLQNRVLRHPEAVKQDATAGHQPYMSAEEALAWMQAHAKTFPGDDMQALTNRNGVTELLDLSDMDTIYGTWCVEPACAEGGEYQTAPSSLDED
jgi:hypothetical protein